MQTFMLRATFHAIMPSTPCQGYPLQVNIIISLVFASTFMDYATDFAVAWSICGTLPALHLPLGTQNCLIMGETDCLVCGVFCGAFSVSSAVDLVINVLLEERGDAMSERCVSWCRRRSILSSTCGAAPCRSGAFPAAAQHVHVSAAQHSYNEKI